jgi:predicted kinase
MAFLCMGLAYQGRRDLAQAFAAEYFSVSKDGAGQLLLPFYTAYRAAVRAKVEGLKLGRPEILEADRAIASAKARGCWLLALAELEQPERRPCLVLVGGLPGTGKSTLAQALAVHAGFEVIRSDLVRKEISGVGREKNTSAFGEGIYSAEWTARTYAECLSRAEALLFQGKRVLVDANFREESHRRDFLDAATRWTVPGAFLICQAGHEVVRTRLASRHDDASDADWPVFIQAAQLWEALGAATQLKRHIINTEGTQEQMLGQALATLRQLTLLR